jgi:hypothetical protein
MLMANKPVLGRPSQLMALSAPFSNARETQGVTYVDAEVALHYMKGDGFSYVTH